jgi:catechol 2,3-dioxygenase-like lactoylglutathione lyase family enzyme
VARSYRWYQTLLGLGPGEPAHSHFGQLADADGTVLLSVHEWGVEDHPTIISPDVATPGNGLILFFRVDDFDAALARARAAALPFEEEPHLNPNTGTMEFSLRDLDGYQVMISAA